MIKYSLNCGDCTNKFEGWFPSSKGLRKISKYVEKNFENVGKKFYKEAKKANKGKRDEKFYGTPSDEEVNKMLDEGIDLFHVPKVKDN